MYILENEYLLVECKSAGAELTRIYSKKHNKEILWNGDKKHWGRQSPVLFPIVGKIKDNETIIEDSICKMTQHGFARDMEFDLKEKTRNSLLFKLTSEKVDKSKYPYEFELYIAYTLNEEKINIQWSVKNIDSKEIYFSIGAHPAFNISSAEELEDYFLEFECRENVEEVTLTKEGYHDKFVPVEKFTKLSLKPKNFENDAMIFTNIDKISIKNKKDDLCVGVHMKDFPLVGIWTPYYKEENLTAPFVCIEPWYGLADHHDTDKVYRDKKYINKLNMDEIFNADYTIEVK